MIEDNPDLGETSELFDSARNGFTFLDQFKNPIWIKWILTEEQVIFHLTP